MVEAVDGMDRTLPNLWQLAEDIDEGIRGEGQNPLLRHLVNEESKRVSEILHAEDTGPDIMILEKRGRNANKYRYFGWKATEMPESIDGPGMELFLLMRGVLGFGRSKNETTEKGVPIFKGGLVFKSDTEIAEKTWRQLWGPEFRVDLAMHVSRIAVVNAGLRHVDVATLLRPPAGSS